MSISLRQIKYFVAAAEVGKVSKAANYLHISQSSVTSAIQELEHRLGVELFIRSPQGMNLSESGRHFLNHAYSILGAVEEALNYPLPKDDVEGILNIAASYTVMGYILPYHIKRIGQVYPKLMLKLFETDHKHITQGLIDGTFDMSLVSTSNICSDQVVTEILFNSPRRLWLPSNHKLVDNEVISFSDIVNEPYIMLNVDEAEHVSEKYWTSYVRLPNIVLTTISIEAVRSMVGNGSGITILSDTVYRPWSLEGKRIIIKNLADPIDSLSIGLAWAKDKELTSIKRSFLEYFRKTCLVPQLMSTR